MRLIYALLLASLAMALTNYSASYSLTVNYKHLESTYTVSCNGFAYETLVISSEGTLTKYIMAREGMTWTVTLSLINSLTWYVNSTSVVKESGALITLTTVTAGYNYVNYILPILPFAPSGHFRSAKYVGLFSLSANEDTFKGEGVVMINVTANDEIRYTLSISNNAVTALMTSASHTVSTVINDASYAAKIILNSIVPLIRGFVKGVIEAISSLQPGLVSQPKRAYLTIITSTWAYGIDERGKFSLPVLILTLRSELTIDEVEVLYGQRLLCLYPYLALSADQGLGLKFYGYYGQRKGTVDEKDLSPPGGIIVSVGEGGAAGGSLGYIPQGRFLNKPFATAVAGVWEVMYVDVNKVETNFKPSHASVTFSDWVGLTTPVDRTYVDLYDTAKVKGEWSLVIWCDKVNVKSMKEVRVKVISRNGEEATIPVPILLQ